MYFYKQEKRGTDLTLYVRDCNFRCPNCRFYYRSVKECFTLESVDLSGIKKVIFAGGEPTNQKRIEEACRFLKEKNIKIEIHTNGWFPCVIQTLCEKNLVDKVVRKLIENPDTTLYEDGVGIYKIEYFGKLYKIEYWCTVSKIKFEEEFCTKD